MVLKSLSQSDCSFFFNWVWCFFIAKLYGWGIVWIFVLAVSGVLGKAGEELTASNPEAALLLLLTDITLLLGFGIFFSFYANKFRRGKYLLNEYQTIGTGVVAGSTDQAILKAQNKNTDLADVENELSVEQVIDDVHKREKGINNMDWKHPLVIIAATAVAVVIVYFIISPYQNCMRERGHSMICTSRTSW